MKKVYDLIVIGGGSGGLTAAAGAAKFGAHVALIEKHKMGGECLWTGCVPSKALIKSAKVAHLINHAEKFGLSKNSAKLSFPKVIDHVQSVIKKIEPHDSPERFTKLGVDVFFGAPKFINRYKVEVKGKVLRAKKFILATGSSPSLPPIPGLKDLDLLTNENIFTEKKFPKSFIVIGGGPIGLEMAQSFSRLGAKVTVLVRSRILGKEDEEAALLIEKVFKDEGIEVIKGIEFVKAEKKSGKNTIYYKKSGRNNSVSADSVLVATGRKPNVEGLNLDGIGVRTNKKGILVNEKLQTSRKNIYAVGDVRGKFLFTHTAGHEGGIALANVLLLPLFKADYRVVPWTTFTDPEVARVGLIESEAKDQGLQFHVLHYPYKDLDRAVTESEHEGFVKVIVDKKGFILGVTAVGPHAGELLPEFTLAMKKKLKITEIYKTIHTYPTLSEAASRVAAKFVQMKLTESRKRLLQRIFGFGR